MPSRALSGSGSVAMGSSALSLFLLASWSWCRRATSAFRFSRSFWLNIRRRKWSQSSLDPVPPCSFLPVFCHLRQWRDERVPLLEEQCCLHLTQHLVQSALNLCLLQQTMQQTGQGCSLPLPAGLLTTSPTSRGGGVLSEEFARVVGEFSKSWLTRHSPALEKVTARMQSHQMD